MRLPCWFARRLVKAAPASFAGLPLFVFAFGFDAFDVLFLGLALRREAAFFVAANAAMRAHAFEKEFGGRDENFRSVAAFDAEGREFFLEALNLFQLLERGFGGLIVGDFDGA